MYNPHIWIFYFENEKDYLLTSFLNSQLGDRLGEIIYLKFT